MRFFADENVDRELIRMLRDAGHEVRTTATPGAVDEVALREAVDAGCIVITEDRDFGRLIFYEGRPGVGVLYLRLDQLPRTAANRRVMGVIAETAGLIGAFVTVEPGRVRRRRLDEDET